MLFAAIKIAFSGSADPSLAPDMAAYMKNNFPFLGIKKPKRSELLKPIFKNFPILTKEQLMDYMRNLWNLSEREYHYAACDLGIKYRKLLDHTCLDFLEELIRTNSWWDSVDTIAPHLIGSTLLRMPSLTPLMDQWIRDSNFWIRRSALIFQLRYKEKTDAARLFDYCLQCADEKEFFIRKAIGWALREYAKTAPVPVLHFLHTHGNRLSPLSFREASKHLSINS